MSRDVMRRLADARPAHLDPATAVDEHTRSIELVRAMEGRRGGRTRRRVVRPMWGLGLVGAATAAALVVATTVAGPDSGGGSSAISPATPPPSAQVVLLAAAAQADRQPDKVRTYWHTAGTSRLLRRVEARTGNYVVVWTRRSESWLSSDPAGRRCGSQQDLGVRPATPADEAAWRRAGSPATVEVVESGVMHGLKSEHSVSPRAPYFSCSPLGKDGVIFSLGEDVTLRDLRALPTDPDKLKALLIKRFKVRGAAAEPMTRTQTSDSKLFSIARDIILQMPVTPQLRAAAFRMIAELRTVRSIGQVPDAEGRIGTAVAVDERTPTGLLQHRLIVDPASGNALAYEKVVLKPGAKSAWPADSREVSFTNGTSEWTDSPPPR